jgi:hypothetical protein
MNCPYCENPANYGPNEEFYGKRYGKSWMCYYCKPCRAYVGTHNNTTRPLGTMANDELRKARMAAHANIDPYWKENGWKRGDVYAALNKHFGHEIHVGESDLETAREIATLEL